jgi:acyl carrier protein
MSTVQDRLNALLVNRFGVQEHDLSKNITFTDLDLDSLTLVELGLAVQKEFGVSIEDDEIKPEDNVCHLVEMIASKSPAGAGQG